MTVCMEACNLLDQDHLWSRELAQAYASHEQLTLRSLKLDGL